MKADIVVKGNIFTGNELKKSDGRVEAFAVKNGTFIYTGSIEGAAAYIGDETKVIDLGAGIALPGFTEGHAHVSSTYEILNYTPLYKGSTPEEYIELLKDFLKKHPDINVLMGRGYRNGAFGKEGPLATMLDQVSIDIPIITIGEDAHSMWVNTKALELAGVTADTEEIKNGEIVRFQDGTPTGWLKEAADVLMLPVLPPLEFEKVKQAILFYQKMALQTGITHAFEPMLNPQRDYDVCVRAYEELAREDKLRIRFQVGYMLYPNDDIEQGIQKAIEYRKRAQEIGSDRYELNTIKLFLDGVLEGHTAFLKEPYADTPESCGAPLWTQERCNRAVKLASSNGFQVHIHTIGDGALDMAIQAFRAAEEAGMTTHAPHAVTHVQIVEEHQFEQLAELGVVVVANPYWHTKDELYYHNLEVPYLGTARAEREYPLASFLRAGCVVSQASDFPVTVPADIMRSLHIMVNRGEPKEDDKEKLNPNEAVSVEEALRIMTVNGAKQGGIEAQTGRIAEGLDADFVILDKNVLTIAPSQLYTAKVTQIFIKGQEMVQDVNS